MFYVLPSRTHAVRPYNLKILKFEIAALPHHSSLLIPNSSLFFDH